eukprot:m.876852 g.876852  ORF g.876852 m.876852 type:complete len:309 (-) comp23580_c0_seq23:2691-3617(-)
MQCCIWVRKNLNIPEAAECSTRCLSQFVIFGVDVRYDVGVVSGSLADISNSLDLSTIQQEAATSGLNFVAGFGALFVSGNVLDRIGRGKTIFFASLLLLGGAAMVSLARSFPVLLVGRALQGLGSGCSWAACSVYITEIAPREYRGALVTLADISINFGILLGYCVDYAVRDHFAGQPNVGWRVAMGLSGVLPLLYCMLFPLLPETPRWLMLKGRETEALHVLQRTTATGTDDDATHGVLRRMRSTLDKNAVNGKQVECTWREALWPKEAHLRSTVRVALFLGMAQQLTGTEAILYYAPNIFKVEVAF